jgi:hypothetical protein
MASKKVSTHRTRGRVLSVTLLSEGEASVLTSIAVGHNDLGDFWAGSAAHLIKGRLAFAGRVAGKCVIYLTPAGMKAAKLLMG